MHRRWRSLILLGVGIALTVWMACGTIQSRRDSDLLIAVAQKNLPAVKSLLDAGADPNLRGTVREWEVYSGLRPAKDLLGDNPDPWHRLLQPLDDLTHPSRRIIAPLSTAATYPDASIAIALIDHGADVNVVHNGYMTPLMDAESNGNAELIQRLLQAKVRIGVWDMIYALNSSTEPRVSIERMRALLAAGADLKTRDSDGKTLLYWYRPEAGMRDPVVAFLVSQGAEWPSVGPPSPAA